MQENRGMNLGHYKMRNAELVASHQSPDARASQGVKKSNKVIGGSASLRRDQGTQPQLYSSKFTPFYNKT